MYQFTELVIFLHCKFIFALQNTTLGGYLDTRRIIYNIYGMMYGLKYILVYYEDSGH